jgi:hypothetical protein
VHAAAPALCSGAIAGGLLIVYTALGFLAAPPLLRSLLV